MKSMGSGWENLKIQLALKGLRGNARYQRGFSAHLSCFKLASSMYVLCKLYYYYYYYYLSFIPQALHTFALTYNLCGNLSLFVSHAMLIRSKVGEAAGHGF